MNKTQLKSLMAILLSCTFSANAGFYKGLDEEGNITYSDRPFDNAEKITPPPITVLDAQEAPAKVAEQADAADSDEAAEVSKYSSVKINSPKDGETLWNATKISIAVQMEPALDTGHGHTVWLISNGKTVIKNSRSPLIEIEGRADRGEYKVQAQIRNKKGKILNRSKTITVYIKNTSVR